MRCASWRLAVPATRRSWPDGGAPSFVKSTVVSGLPITLFAATPILLRVVAPPDGAGRHANRRHPGRHVTGHDGAGARHRSPADPDRGSEHGVDTDERAIFDHRRVLPGPIVVGGDRARSVVPVLAARGAPKVGHGRNLAAPPDAGAHELGEAADVHVLADPRAAAQLGV